VQVREKESGAADPYATKGFVKDGQALWVTWKKSNKRVISFLLEPDPAAEPVNEEKRGRLLRAGNLQESDTRYTVEWVEAADKPLFYSGVKVIPQPVQHQVIFASPAPRFDRAGLFAAPGGSRTGSHCHHAALGNTRFGCGWHHVISRCPAF
jgi:hypothetical protein